ncbi:MAG: TerC family protein [Verrucomicrobiota bacterium]
MNDTPLVFWIGFNLFVLAMLALDLGVFNRRAHVVGMREALGWSAVWVALAMVFNGFIYWWHGARPATEFFTAYLLEKALSVDNLFVFALLFAQFRIPAESQHRVLFWGILGALVMRALFIATGVTLVAKFHWMIPLFGVFLIFTGIKMGLAKDSDADPAAGWFGRWVRRRLPVSDRLDGQRFWTRVDGRRLATPLLLVLVLIEFTDVLFALDSIPAVLAVTRDPFIVYTSNIFAILGLRALYFALAGVMRKFHLLHYALAFILVFIGGKMVAELWLHLPVFASLAVIAMSLALAVGGSLLRPEKRAA